VARHAHCKTSPHIDTRGSFYVVQSKERTATGDGARRPTNGHGPRPVLFAVEDDPSTLELLRDVAVHAGWALRGFTQLADFERAVAQHVPDLVILDDDLPDGRGGDRARELRSDRRLRDVPVLVCTAAPARRQAEIGAWAPVVSKPFALGDIELVLQDAAQRRGLEAHSAGG
jgi:DNA-binding response OmpR family regulator